MTHPKINTLIIAFCITAAFALLSSPSAQAQTQGAMNVQAARGAAKADAAMNTAYKKLLTVLNTSQEAHLRQAQRAWLVYRDNEAALSASVSEGGTMYPTLYSSEIEELTENRTRELKRDYETIKL